MRTLETRLALIGRWLSEQSLKEVEDHFGITKYLQEQGETSSPTAASTQPSSIAKINPPRDSTAALIDYYGKPGSSNLTRITFPYPMRLAWDLSKPAKSSRCHKKVKESLESCLEQILKHYGSIYEVRKARMDRFGGIYNFRKMRGGSSYSRHSWGIAIDLDPDENGLRTRRPKATMPDAVLDIFEAHGWKTGGRAWGRDFMHMQATK